MVMHNPPHPGKVIRELCIEPLGLSVTGRQRAWRIQKDAFSAA